MDRVLLPGVAYDFIENDEGKTILSGKLKTKTAVVLNTSNPPSNMEKDPLDALWKNSVFKICGVNQVERKNFSSVIDSDESQRTQWLAEVRQMMDALFPKT